MQDQQQAQSTVGEGSNGRFLPFESVRIGMDGPISVVDLTALPDCPGGVRLEIVVDRSGEAPRLPAPGQAIEIGHMVRRDGVWELHDAPDLPMSRSDRA